MSWKLVDIYELNKEYPYTTYVPSKDIINKLKVGDYVKLEFTNTAFLSSNKNEKMWVHITEINGNSFAGDLNNEPQAIKKLKFGQRIEFKTNHIINTLLKDPTSSKYDYYMENFCVISKDVLERNEFNFILKDDSEEDNDTGLIVFSGYEGDTYNDDPDNFQIVALGVILNIDDSILSFINEAKPLTAYERNEDGVFNLVDDYVWADDYTS